MAANETCGHQIAVLDNCGYLYLMPELRRHANPLCISMKGNCTRGACGQEGNITSLSVWSLEDGLQACQNAKPFPCPCCLTLSANETRPARTLCARSGSPHYVGRLLVHSAKAAWSFYPSKRSIRYVWERKPRHTASRPPASHEG